MKMHTEKERERKQLGRMAGEKGRGAKGDSGEVGRPAAAVPQEIKFPRLP